MNIQNITVTNARLKRALANASGKRTGGTSASASSESGETVPCKLYKTPVVKWYLGLDKVVVLVDEKEQEAFISYPYIDKDFVISACPDGSVVEAEDGAYVVPSNTTAYTLKVGEEFLVIGFKQNLSTLHPDYGEILLQAGENKIQITKEFINITTNNLYINGERHVSSGE